MLGLVSSKKYKNTTAYRNLELQKLRKHYDEVLQPQVDAAFAEMRERMNPSEPKTQEFTIESMLDTDVIETIN